MTARSQLVPSYFDTCVVRIVSIDIDDSVLWFFRNEGYELPIKITPSSFSDPINVSLSGFDNTHWKAEYNSTMKKIDLSNLIQQTEAVGWLDDQVLAISASIGSVADEFALTKPLKLKKRVDDIYDKLKEKGIKKINEAISPAEEISKLIQTSMERISAVDSEGIVCRIPPSVIRDTSSSVRTNLDDWWRFFIDDYIWSEVPVSSVRDFVVNESWTFDWNVEAIMTVSGGTISLHPKFSDVADWIKLVSSQGFSSSAFSLDYATIRAYISANGLTASADIEACMSAFLRYSSEMMIDTETKERANGHLDYGFGISIHIWF